MYKVFINEKPVILTGNTPKSVGGDKIRMYQHTGLMGLGQITEALVENQNDEEPVVINSKDFQLLRNDFLSLFDPVTAAGGIVFHPEKGMLWIRRHGRWDLPKGKIDRNEKVERAAIREVEEETGIRKISIRAPLGTTHHAYREKNSLILKTSHWFVMETEKPDSKLIPQLNEGIMEVAWADENSVQEKIDDTWASLKELAADFVTKYTRWKIRFKAQRFEI